MDSVCACSGHHGSYYLSKDFSAYKQLSAAGLIPVIGITVVIFLLKTGVLSALLIGLKKLWEQIKKQ